MQPSQCRPLRPTCCVRTGCVVGGLTLLQPKLWKRPGLQDSLRSSSGPFTARCLFVESARRVPSCLPKAGLFAAAVADVPGRAGQPSFCGSQVPLQPGMWANAQPWHSPLSLADPSGPGHHDRCWEHMPGINSLHHSHKRDSRLLRLLPTPWLSDFDLAKRKIRLFSLPCC